MRWRRASWIAGAVPAALGCVGPGEQPGLLRYRVDGVVQVTGFAVTAPLGMDPDGVIAGYVATAPYAPLSRAIVVRADGGVQVLGAPGLTSLAWQARGPGLVVGESEGRATAWIDGVAEELAAVPFTFGGAAQVALASGGIAGSCGGRDQIGPRHCFWSGVGSDPLVLESTTPSRAPIGGVWGANAAAQLVGATGGLTGFTAVRWDPPGYQPVEIGALPGAVNGEARAINDRGEVVGRSGFPDNTVTAFRWTAAGGLVALPHLSQATRYAEAFGIDRTGTIVGTSTAGDGTVRAVIWVDGRIVDLNDRLAAPLPAELTLLTAAVGIDRSGRIAAAATTATGGTAIVRLVPP